MVAEIPQKLNDKLKIIELEADFFSSKVQKPSRYLLIGSGANAALLMVFFVAFESMNDFFMLILLFLAVSQIASYFFSKRFFNMYSSAREIINFYKKQERPQN